MLNEKENSEDIIYHQIQKFSLQTLQSDRSVCMDYFAYIQTDDGHGLIESAHNPVYIYIYIFILYIYMYMFICMH